MHQFFLPPLISSALLTGLVGCSPPSERRPLVAQDVATRVDAALAGTPIRRVRRGPPGPDADALAAAAGLPESRRAIQMVGEQERVVDVDEARRRGLTLVDLSDDWAPAIFADGVAPDGATLPNRYRSIFVGLANDRTDGDGQPVAPGERNFLELYGVPASLSVLRERFVADATGSCHLAIDRTKLLGVDKIATWGATTEKNELRLARLRGLRLEQVAASRGLSGPDELATSDPKYGKEVRQHQHFLAERAAFTEVEKRLACEGLYDPNKHKAGLYDTPMRLAMLAFQQKNVVMEQGDLGRASLEALAVSALEHDFAALRRVLAERLADAAGYLEDGSATRESPKKVPTYKNSRGERVPVPDLVGEGTAALMARAGIANGDDALDFFRAHGKADFRWLKVAVRLPTAPEYYAREMDLSAEIDRGDVWYDFPFSARGERVPQPRRKYPSFTLYTKWMGERVPLVRWRSTIGGWRTELASDGRPYLRYKNSDVGRRVWRHLVVAPVWIPPASSLLESMVKTKNVNGVNMRVTNYDEVGPGYLSAYGLVAAIHEEMRRRGDRGATFFDNGIRTHGSFDYLSLRGRFSHGCHRLFNNLAVRLFSFVLAHRKTRTVGPVALNFRRTFWQKGEVFDMRLPTRGFYYVLDPPLPVETLQGDIQGVAQAPLAGYVRKPDEEYGKDPPPAVPGGPESKAGGGGEIP